MPGPDRVSTISSEALDEDDEADANAPAPRLLVSEECCDGSRILSLVGPERTSIFIPFLSCGNGGNRKQ